MDQDPADVRAGALWLDRKRKPHCFGLIEIKEASFAGHMLFLA
jgi:hypothetical protein